MKKELHIKFWERVRKMKTCWVWIRCDNPPCVNPKHLWAGTQTDNMQDMVAKGRMSNMVGENNPKAKLNKDRVSKIRELLSRKVPHKYIAKHFNVCKGTIDLISRKVSWND